MTDNPFVFGDVQSWTRPDQEPRKGWLDQQQNMSPAELEIQKSLSQGRRSQVPSIGRWPK